MADIEKNLFIPHHPEFQPVIGYIEAERSPRLIVRQTHTLLGLYHSDYQGDIRALKPTRDYLHDYTLGYLNAAAEGANTIYSQTGKFDVYQVDMEIRETAYHAFVVLSALPDIASSSYPKGFSRIATLRPPSTQQQFLARIAELKAGIYQVIAGQIEPGATLEGYPPILRTFKFFEVGSKLPIKFVEDQRKKEQIEKERLNDLLAGIDISL